MTAKSVLLDAQQLLDPDLEHTLIIVKPDGFARGFTGEIIRRIELKGYTIKGLKLVVASKELLAEHYREHKDKPFFEGLLEFMSSGPVVAIIVEGQRVVEGMRVLMGSTDPKEAAPGTLRADFAEDKGRNAVHGSDSLENAAREIAFFFAERELCR